jgi:Diacylglycerol kinase catalytic domain
MTSVALISNPHSTRNGRLLPEIRKFVAATPHVFHVELHDVSEIPDALRLIARVSPKVLVINGGDGTVQAVLTSLYHEKAFGAVPPPVAVLPNGKTNLIAADLGVSGSPMRVLERIVELAEKNEIVKHTVMRPMIALEDGRRRLPVMGMFLGGAGLKNSILFCRHKIYPLGLPNAVSHLLTYFAFAWSILIGGGSKYAPVNTDMMRITTRKSGSIDGKFTVLMVTTLDHILMGMQPVANDFKGGLKLLCMEEKRRTVFRALGTMIFSKLGRMPIKGVHMRNTDEIRLDGANTSVILDGELFVAAPGRPMILRTTEPQKFISLAAA